MIEIHLSNSKSISVADDIFYCMINAARASLDNMRFHEKSSFPYLDSKALDLAIDIIVKGDEVYRNG